MSWKKKPSRSWSLAARLTTWYAVASFVLTLFATGLLYWVLTTQLDRSEDLFLADKVNVLRAILLERPDDVGGLREEVELESAARRYAQFYVRLLDENGRASLTTPGMDGLLSPSLFTVVVPSDVEPSHGTGVQAQQGGSFWLLAAKARV